MMTSTINFRKRMRATPMVRGLFRNRLHPARTFSAWKSAGAISGFDPLRGLQSAILPDGRRRWPDPSNADWRAIGFELQFVFFALLVRCRTRDAGNLSGREISKLRATANRRLDKRHRQAVDFRSIPRAQQRLVDGQFVQTVRWPPAVFAG